VDCKHNKAPDKRGWACGVSNEECPGVQLELKRREIRGYNRRRLMDKPAHLIVKDMKKRKADLLEAIADRGLPPPTLIQDFNLWYVNGRNYLYIEIREKALEVCMGQAGTDAEEERDWNASIHDATVRVNAFHGWPA
jgi:hypothetical protein